MCVGSGQGSGGIGFASWGGPAVQCGAAGVGNSAAVAGVGVSACIIKLILVRTPLPVACLPGAGPGCRTDRNTFAFTCSFCIAFHMLKRLLAATLVEWLHSVSSMVSSPSKCMHVRGRQASPNKSRAHGFTVQPQCAAVVCAVSFACIDFGTV